MCGRLNVSDDPLVIGLMGALGMPLFEKERYPLRTGRFIKATNVVSIVLEEHGQRRLQDAIWWLLLEPTETGFKPSQYTSFNTRYDKLNVKGSAGYIPYRKQRCIIPASGFGETEVSNGKTLYTDFIGNEAIAFGGLYRTWVHKDTGEMVYSCSVITLPPHPKLKPYHTKAMPLMLPKGIMDDWLSPGVTNTDLFNDLLKPVLRVDLKGITIDKPSHHQQIGESFELAKDND
ncbi:SOS response-associated peptidase [Rheinheimera sp. 4Y26]|uniref:SOS response-associated peptidase n=1 Tax=Rheinheimera sp. 4Y26 TaxID=2977811 RepID=UPI0021B11BC2|nr:SOS response-associated peptidase [Rheinheimera sp. 4Y26]MCT6700932.1 SOS response-associated peptidase [Rheinheimera sp. 4Y26]